VEPGSKLVITFSALLAVFAASCGTKRTAGVRRPSVTMDARHDFRPTAWEVSSEHADVPAPHVVRELLCAAAETAVCEESCLALPPHEAAACALDLAYSEDADARAVAHELLALTGAVPGLEKWHDIDAAYLGRVPIEPVLPIGPYKQHLVWIRDALTEIERVFEGVARAAPRPVLFRSRPHGFRFFRTAERSYPSAYAVGGIVGYNVEGPLHGSLESVTATLLHEIFHLNDEGHGQWTQAALVPVFERIVDMCGSDEPCLTTYAPSDDRVPGGTYYPFDPGTRDVREYGAELALRWFREQRAMLDELETELTPFRCASEENAKAWRAMVDEFFGGLDLGPECG
jgi:hypothetical protein